MIESYYDRFLYNLQSCKWFEQGIYKEHAGQRFIYVQSPLKPSEVTDKLLEEAHLLTHGTKLSIECVYVRSSVPLHVYRFRFLVPNEKQFCCGNLCVDCFRLRT